MNMITRYLFTPRGIQRLKDRIALARQSYRDICDENEDAAGAGDSSVWHDNFAYEENQRQMHQRAKKVRDLEAMLAAAEVVMPGENRKDMVGVGCVVSYLKDDEETPREYFISGYDDGDPTQGRISYNSPLGRQLVGARKGDVIELRQRRRMSEVEILEVTVARESD